MAESILGKLGFGRASGVDKAGWGRTLAVAVVAFIYFLPVLFMVLIGPTVIQAMRAF